MSFLSFMKKVFSGHPPVARDYSKIEVEPHSPDPLWPLSIPQGLRGPISIPDYLGTSLAGSSADLTQATLLKTALTFLSQVNSLLSDLGINRVQVTSGFRTPVQNRAACGSPNSYHLHGRAVDLYDPHQYLSRILRTHPELLRKHSLWMEDPSATPTHVHLDNGTRPDRSSRLFYPNL